MRNHRLAAILRSLLAFSLALALPCGAEGTTIPIVNPSFEEPATDPGTFVTGSAPNGWAAYGSINFSNRAIGVLNPADTSLYVEAAPERDNVGVVFLLPSAATESGLQQTLSATLQTSTDYTLEVAVGNIANDPNPPHNSFDFGGFPGYRVELLAGASVIASDDNSLLPGEGRFLTSTVRLTTGMSESLAGQPLTIRLINLDGPAGIEVNFDDVRLDAAPVATPTPSPTPSTAACPATPQTDCKVGVSGKGKLSLKRAEAVSSRNTLSWSWTGEATTLAEYGSPLSTSDYRWCLYDGRGEVVVDLTAAAGRVCDGRPCWKAKGTGFGFKDRSRLSAGLDSLSLRTGAEGRASIRVKAKGIHLSLPELPLVQTPEPVIAVLLNEESGLCWRADFSTILGDPGPTRWKSRND